MFTIMFVLLVILWIGVNRWIFEAIARRKIYKIDRLLTDDCDLENYVAIYEMLAKKRADGETESHVLLNLSTAYLTIGNIQAGGQILSILNHHPGTRSRSEFAFSYYNNVFAYSLQNGDISAATQSLEQMEHILKVGKFHAVRRDELVDAYVKMQYRLKMESGNYDGCEAIFALAFLKAENRFRKVYARYILGKIYLHYGKTTEAEEAFTYVVNYGGSSVYKRMAIEYLESLGISLPIQPEERRNVQIFSRKERAIGVVALTMLVLLTLFAVFAPRPTAFQSFDEFWISQLRFFPTMDEAFTRNSGDYANMGEIFFIDECEDSIVILHRAYDRRNNSSLYVSTFLREIREGEAVYAFLSAGGSWAVNVSLDPEAPSNFISIETYRSFLASRTRAHPFPEFSAINRKPLHGFANDVSINYLTINGQPVDYVIDIGPDEEGSRESYFIVTEVANIAANHTRECWRSIELLEA